MMSAWLKDLIAPRQSRRAGRREALRRLLNFDVLEDRCVLASITYTGGAGNTWSGGGNWAGGGSARG